MEHPDIKFLKRRLKYLVEMEQYEVAAKIKLWIDELSKKHQYEKERTRRVFWKIKLLWFYWFINYIIFDNNFLF